MSLTTVAIIAGAAIALYSHRAYLKAQAAKAIAEVEANHAVTLLGVRSQISTALSLAKAEAAKAETTAVGIVAAIESRLKSIL